MPSERPESPARFIVFFLNGKTRKVADYKDRGDRFSIGSTRGFQTDYPRWMIDRIEPIVEADETPDEPSAVYIAHYKSGKSESLIDFYEDDGAWVLFFVSGGRARLPKSMIDYFEPTPDAIKVVRRWTDSVGSHHTTAKFVGVEGEKVVLIKGDGGTVRVPLEKLSEVDQDIARRLQELMK